MLKFRQGVLCVAILLTALEATAACKPWVEVRTDRIRAISDRPQEEILTIVDTLSRFEDFVSRITAAGKFQPSRPTLVVMLSRTEWSRYIPDSSRIGGLFRTGQTENLILLPEPSLKPKRYTFPPPPPSLKRDEPNPYSTILHEYVHFVMLDGTVRYPRWYTEGMADVLGDILFEGAQMRFGVLWYYELDTARSARTVSFADLIERFPSHDGSSKPIVTQEAYALSKSLVHYLSFGAPARVGQVQQFISLWNDGVADTQAFRAAFGTDYAGMEKELDQYLRRTSFPGGYMDWNALSGAKNLITGSLACDEAMAETGLALLSIGADRQTVSNGWFQLALREVPGSVPARIGLAHIAEAEKDVSAADRLLDAIKPEEMSLRWRNWAGSLLLRRAFVTYKDQREQEAATVERAIRLYPDFNFDGEPEAAQAYYQSAVFNLYDDSKTDAIDKGIEQARKAVAVRPKDTSSAYLAAFNLQKRGEMEDAAKYWQVVAQYSQSSTARQNARTQIQKIRSAASQGNALSGASP